MAVQVLVWLIGSAAAALLVSVYRAATSPLRSVPGPFLARFTDAWYFWRLYLGTFNVENRNLHSRYGPIVRYGPSRYSFSGGDASRVIYAHGTHFRKSSWYIPFTSPSPGQWSLFGDQNIRRHASNRRLYQSTYSMTALITYEPFVDECTELFTQRLSELAEAGAVNLGHWLQCFAFDVVGLITYSKRLGFLDRGEDVGGVIAALDGHMVYASVIGLYPSLHKYLFRIKNWLAGKKGAGRGYVLSFTQERIAEHQSSPKIVPTEEHNTGPAVDFLTKFLAKQAADPETFTNYHTLAGCVSNMIAGSDTTASSISGILYYLLRHPRCLENLRDEVQAHTVGKEVSRFITFKESQCMVYLQAVIKEALRMHAATGLPLERVVPEGGATISGRFFPVGTIVGINSWVEHMNPLIFGDDAEDFRPERWLVDDPEKISLMNRHWMPFGLGSRTCIGRHISMLQIGKFIPLLVRDFDFELCGDVAKENKRLEMTSYFFVKPTNFTVRVTARS